MINDKPTLLLVHGAWHTPAHFETIRKVFEKAGYPTRAPLLAVIDGYPPTGPIEDAQRVKAELVRLVVEEEKEVIVIGHSYGGLVITQAVDASFSKKNREAAGKKGGVIHLFYMCAVIIPSGESVATAFGWPEGELPDFVPVDKCGQCMITEPAKRFYGDLPEDDQTKWVTELRMMSSTALTNPIAYTAFLHYPVSYLFTTNDGIVPYSLQEKLVKNAEETFGIKIRTTTCDAAHSPFISQPGVVLKIVLDITHGV